METEKTPDLQDELQSRDPGEPMTWFKSKLKSLRTRGNDGAVPAQRLAGFRPRRS
mgnify:CR=1 FL=1